MIHVIAKIEVVSGKRADFLAEFHKLVPLVLAEQGCVAYGPTVDAVTDIDAQKSAGNDVAIIIEQWESLEALKDHLQADHMAAYRQRVSGIVASTTLEIYETV